MLKNIFNTIKKEPMLLVALIAAILSLFVTPPDKQLLSAIDWKTLATLFMLITVLEGFKKENIFLPLIKFTGRFNKIKTLSVFLYFLFFLHQCLLLMMYL